MHDAGEVEACTALDPDELAEGIIPAPSVFSITPSLWHLHKLLSERNFVLFA